MIPGRTRRSPATLLALVLIGLLLARLHADAMPFQRTLRLCSRSLSDALFLVCKDRGFNEPFSYSEEESDDDRRPATTAGPRAGLVQECCHHSCSLEQLERYCKPLPQPSRREDAASRGNAIAGSDAGTGFYRIVSLPFSSVKELQVAKGPQVHSSRPGRGRSRASRRRKRRKNRRKCACQRHGRRQRRLRISNWRKVSGEAVIPEVPAFQVGTTSPEPIDSIVVFPFNSELRFGRIDSGAAAGPEEGDIRRSR